MPMFIETEEGLSIKLNPPMETAFLRKSDGYNHMLLHTIVDLVRKASEGEYQRGYSEGYEAGKNTGYYEGLEDGEDINDKEN